jgi:hypothetical protein
MLVSKVQKNYILSGSPKIEDQRSKIEDQVLKIKELRSKREKLGFNGIFKV